MPIPDYIAAIRRAYGQGRLLLPGVSAVVLRDDLEPARVHLLLTRRSDTGRNGDTYMAALLGALDPTTHHPGGRVAKRSPLVT